MVMRLCLLVLVALASATAARAQGAPDPPPQPSPDEPAPTFEEQVVVSASRVEQRLVNAPAAVTVVDRQTIQNSPATNIGDLLRAVPGINVTQLSARDVNLTTRGATSTLSTSQLALVDGRSIYLDFFGMVMWDLVPTNPSDIDRIEVIRGPASAVWGANAMTGVVNVITRSPRELAAAGRGNSVTIGAGGFGRDVAGLDRSAGSMFYVNGSHARAVDDRWSYKVSAAYLTQDAMARPVGTLPNVFRTPYPAFENEGTSQPKFDVRVDYDVAAGGRVTLSGGVAGTEGLIHSGVGPFRIGSDSRMTYGSARYEREGRRVAFFTNLLNGKAANLLTRGPDGAPLPLDFDTTTIDLEASDVAAIGTRHAVSFGGNFRRNTFDISLAPDGDDRNEGGAYVQDEIFLSDRFRWLVGGRVDSFSSIDGVIFSPRTTFMYKPSPNQTVRLSYNQAFRAPSFVNNHINVTLLNEVSLAPLGVPPALARFIFPLTATGSPDLEEERLRAWELGYVGTFQNRVTVSAAAYWNRTENGIYFTRVAAYSAADPPPNWPLPAGVLSVIARLPTPIILPSRFTYLNLGTVYDKGLELGVDAEVNQYLDVFANYSLQARPEVEEFATGTGINDINWPAKHRVNVGATTSYARYIGNLTVNYTDEAYWQDVLDARFAGVTEPFTLVNLGLGARWRGERITTALKITNLANQAVQQHVFGDVMRRQVVGEVRLDF
jgi:iron complex outermembrane receptor protein